MRGVHAREDEPGGDRLAVGAVAEGDGLGAVAPSRAISSPIGSGLRSGRSRVGARAVLALAGWDRERGALLEHLRVRADRQHVLAPGLIEAIAQPGVPAIGVIAEHRRLRDTPSPQARSTNSTPSSDLVLNATRSGIFALRRRSLIRAPVLGQIQRPPQRHRPRAPDRVHRHPDLTVTRLPQRPRVLTLDPRRVLAVLREPRVIQHPRLDLDLRRDPLSHRLDHQRRIPRAISHELLHRLIVSVPAQPLDDRLKRLASTLLQQARADTTRR